MAMPHTGDWVTLAFGRTTGPVSRSPDATPTAVQWDAPETIEGGSISVSISERLSVEKMGGIRYGTARLNGALRVTLLRVMTGLPQTLCRIMPQT